MAGVWRRTGRQALHRGVGDKTTLVLLPWVAAARVKIAKMSEARVGTYTAAPWMLSSIPGFRFDLTRTEFIRAVKDWTCRWWGRPAI